MVTSCLHDGRRPGRAEVIREPRPPSYSLALPSTMLIMLPERCSFKLHITLKRNDIFQPLISVIGRKIVVGRKSHVGRCRPKTPTVIDENRVLRTQRVPPVRLQGQGQG